MQHLVSPMLVRPAKMKWRDGNLSSYPGIEMKKYFVYLYPALVNGIFGAIFAVEQKINLPGLDLLFLAAILLILLFNMVIGPIYLAVQTHDLITKGNSFYLPLSISFMSAVLSPLIYHVIWIISVGYANYSNDIGAFYLMRYNILIPAIFMICFAAIELVRLKIIPHVKK